MLDRPAAARFFSGRMPPLGAGPGGTCLFLGVDWSGSTRGGIATCLLDASSGRLDLALWSSRSEAVAYILGLGRDLRGGLRCPGRRKLGRARPPPGGGGTSLPRLLVGLDFCFSFPAWFLEELGVARAPDVWEVVRERGEEWLRLPPFPFFGRARPRVPSHGPARREPRPSRRGGRVSFGRGGRGAASPARGGQGTPPLGRGGQGWPWSPPLFRSTEEVVLARGLGRPQSVFKLVGAGSVGTASLRGMPYLLELRRAGFSVWPFDPLGELAVVEVYPRLFLGSLRKVREAERTRFARELGILGEAARAVVASADALDALAAAVGMARTGAGRLREYPPEFLASSLVQREGWIFPLPPDLPETPAGPLSAAGARLPGAVGREPSEPSGRGDLPW